MKHLVLIILSVLVMTGFSACNTVKGAGQDVSAAGHDVTKAASTVQKKMTY